MVYSRICKDEQTLEKFHNFVKKCWNEPRGFALIVNTATEPTKYIDGSDVTKTI